MKKITVRVHGDHPQNIKVKPHITSEGRTQLILLKAKKDRFGWTVDATGQIQYDDKGNPFVDVVRGAKTPLKIDINNNSSTQDLTLDEYQTILDLKTIQARWGKLSEKLQQLLPWIIGFGIITIVSLVVSGFNAYQISQLPHTLPTVTPPPVVVP